MLRKSLGWIIKILVAVLAYAFVWKRLANQDYTKLFHVSDNGLKVQLFLMLLVVLLMLLNWALETLKWQYALKDIYPTGFGVALKSALYGAGVGLFTPNKIGDSIARAAILSTPRKTEAGMAAFQCAFAQQLATLIFGTIGIVILSTRAQFSPYFHNPWVVIILFVALVLTSFLVFRQEWVAIKLEGLPFLQRKGFSSSSFSETPSQNAIFILILSLLRYVVFSTQFVLMLHVFGYSGEIHVAYAAIFCSYLFAGIVPQLAIAEAGVRSGFAIIFVGAFWNQPGAITLAAHVVWIINVALPALGGVMLPFFKRGDW